MADYDPGPVPPVPERIVRVIAPDPRTLIIVASDPGTGLTLLAIQQAGHVASAALPTPSVDALLAALAAASATEEVPSLPTVEVVTR